MRVSRLLNLANDAEGRALRGLAQGIVVQDVDERFVGVGAVLCAEDLATKVVLVDDGNADVLAERLGDLLRGFSGFGRG